MFKKFLFGALATIGGVAFAATISYFGSGSADHVGVALTNLLYGEDSTNNVMRTESQFSYCLDDADLVCKATPGFLHTVSCWGEDAASTAGRVQIRDSSTATGGTVVWQHEFGTSLAPPVSWTADIIMTAGVAIDWDTTADVFCTVSYR